MPPRPSHPRPTADLSQVREILSRNQPIFFRQAKRDLNRLNLSIPEAIAIICKLRLPHFYKTDPCKHPPGPWVDIYKTNHHPLDGLRLYIKFYVSDDRLIIQSFKECTP